MHKQIKCWLQGLGNEQDTVEEDWICQVIEFDWVYLKYDVLKAVAEGGSKGVGGVCGGGPVENDRSVWGFHLLADTVPLCIRRDLQIKTSVNFLKGSWQCQSSCQKILTNQNILLLVNWFFICIRFLNSCSNLWTVIYAVKKWY